MKIKIIAFAATSLDGFIARQDDSLDWLDQANKRVPKGEDCGYKEFLKSIEIIVMGRVTFEKVLTFDKWPYEEKRIIVLSNNEIKIPIELQKTVLWSSLKPYDLVQKLSKEGKRNIYVDGGNTIQRFLLSDLLDEITITIIPILLGKGKRLFSEIAREIKLELIGSKSYDFGFVQNKYRIRNKKGR